MRAASLQAAALLLLLPMTASASPEAAARAALALAAAQAQPAADPYTVAYRAMLEQDVPLVVWVGLDCPPCRSSLTDCNHVKVETFAGDASPRVVVNVRGLDGKGYFFGAVPFNGGMSAAQIRQWITTSRELVRPKPAPVQQPQTPRFDYPAMPFSRGSGRGG